MNDKKGAVFTVLKSPLVRAMMPTLPLVVGLIEQLAAAGERVENAKGEEDGLATVLAKKEALARIAEATARVQQELAIATRIATADEVEIEEFYEGATEGSAGVKAEGKGMSVGLSGSARRATRRVVRFKGWNGAVSSFQESSSGDVAEGDHEAES